MSVRQCCQLVGSLPALQFLSKAISCRAFDKLAALSDKNMKRYCLALDLKDDPELIAEYEAHHRNVWPENIAGIKASGIQDMQIFRSGNRLFMIMETSDDFSFAEKAALDAANEKVQEWETLMSKYQQPLPWAKPGEKWMLMEQIFKL